MGAPADDDDDDDLGTNSGSAYVFVRNGNSWSQQDKLVGSYIADNARFGTSLDISANTIVVGAPQHINENVLGFSGSAYVFMQNGTSWTEQAKLVSSDLASLDWFGWSVAISGDTIIVGAYLHDDLYDVTGSAYIFVQSDGVWSQQAKLKASDAAESDKFGYSVSISGNIAVVGAIWDDDAGNNSGSAYVFKRGGTTWTEQTKLTASDDGTRARLGSSVFVSGDTVFTGAPEDNDFGSASGAVYLFALSNNIAVTLTSPNTTTTHNPGDTVNLEWTTTGGNTSDTMVLSVLIRLSPTPLPVVC